MSTTSKEMGTDYKYELDSEFDNKLANLQLEPIPGRIDLEKEGPSKEDKEASDQIQKPSLLSRIINKLTRPRTAAVVGASLAPAALVAACTPSSQQTEVRPVSPPRAEIQPTPIINTEKLDVREILVEAKDPADMSKKASFPIVAPTPTATKTPESTSTPTPAPTPTETPTPVPKEKPTSLTEKNFAEFVTPVSKEEFAELAKAQPDNFAFPVKPSNGDFIMTYLDRPALGENVKGSFKSIRISGIFKLLRIDDGEINISRTDPFQKDKITHIEIFKQTANNTTISIEILTNDAKVNLVDNNDNQKGSSLAQISGNIALNIALLEKLPETIVIKKPDGVIVEFSAYVNYLTPSPFELSGWINQKGKVVIPQGN